MPRVNGPGTVLILQLHIVALAEVLLAGDRQLKPPEPRLLFQRRRLRAEQLCFAQPVGLADEARDDTPQALDAVWEEEQVKFFADKGCGDSAITAHQRRFAGAVAPQYLNITTGGQH